MRTSVKIDLKNDKSVTVYSDDDVEDVLEHNKMLRETPQKSDWGRHIASIPNVIVVKWLNSEWESGNNIRYLSKEWDQLVIKKLRDPEWAYLRTDHKSHRIGWK